jgi:hypothetical protein
LTLSYKATVLMRRVKRLDMIAQYILDNLPNWIQAFAAISIVGLTLVTLIVLKDYATDTKRIARASVSQLENAQMPFLALIMRESLPDNPGGWGIQNQGFGPAMNVSFGSGRSDAAVRHLGSMPTGETQPVHYDIEDAFGLTQQVVIEYESLSGMKYRTIVAKSDDVMNTKFDKL